MTRTIVSGASCSTNSSSVWISKLACRRHRNIETINIETSIDSIEITSPLFMEYGQVTTTCTLPSFSTCTTGCNKLSFEERNRIVNSDAMLDSTSDQCNAALHDFNKKERVTENEMTLGNDYEGKNVANRELLSNSVELLHEVHINRLPSCTGVFFVPNWQSALEEEFHVANEEPHTKRNGIIDMNGDIDSSKTKCSERMIFRQRMRYDAIRKELFDSSRHSSNEMKTSSGKVLDREYLKGQESVECHAAALWNSLPNMPSIFSARIQQNDVFTKDADVETDSEVLSYTDMTYDETSIFTVESDTSESDDDDDDDDDSKDVLLLDRREGNSPSIVSLVRNYMKDQSHKGSTMTAPLRHECSPVVQRSHNQNHRRRGFSDLKIEELADYSRERLDTKTMNTLRNDNCIDGGNGILPFVECNGPLSNEVEFTANSKGTSQWLTYIEQSLYNNEWDYAYDEQNARRDAANAALKRISDAKRHFKTHIAKKGEFWY